MALLQLLDVQGSVTTIAVISLLVWPLLLAIYRLYFHPLAHIPGPFLARVSSLWLFRHTYMGNEPVTLQRLHVKYGPIMRIAPNEVDVANGEALHAMHIAHGGFRKAPYYANFDIDGHPTIFSGIEPGHRLLRAKAVMGMFSTTSIREGYDKMAPSLDRFVARLRQAARTGEPIDILNMSRSCVLDTLSAYLFGRCYDGLEESRLSAGPFVDAFVGVGRLFYLPTWLFGWVDTVVAQLDKNKHDVEKSMQTVDDFVAKCVGEKNPEDTYQGRLKIAGLSDHEIMAQCKDLIFAGTDSTGNNLATIMWHLVRQPEILGELREALEARPPSSDPLSVPYLRAVLNEGLRLSLAQPARFPRVVPASGFKPLSSSPIVLPAGTIVGVTPYIMYFDPDTFPDPFSFQPVRWLASSDSSSAMASSSPTSGSQSVVDDDDDDNEETGGSDGGEKPSTGSDSRSKRLRRMHRDFNPFGQGPRACIARNLAMAELAVGVDKVVRSGVLEAASTVLDKIEVVQWFNGRVVGGKIELVWKS